MKENEVTSSRLIDYLGANVDDIAEALDESYDDVEKAIRMLRQACAIASVMVN